MTFLEFIGMVVSTDAERIEAQQRKGQWAFNKLSNARLDIADKIHIEFGAGRSDIDPFYNDENLERFWIFVAENW